MTFEPVRTAVIGLGEISTVYLHAITRSPALDLSAVASRKPDKAEAVAALYRSRAATVDELLRDDRIELVVNLTPAAEHDSLNRAIVETGKHLYSEKPFCLSLEVAQQLAEEAARRNVRIGCAPDTFFGAGHQASRRRLDDGAIGDPVFGLSFVGLPGLEHFHPNPAGFYRPGGEPPFDIGPYFVTQWINLLGPVRRVYAATGKGPDEREIRRGPQAGTRFPVEVPTTFNTVLTFDSASVSLIMSLDVQELAPRPNELFGTAGTLALSDPIFFGGTPILYQPGAGRQPIETTAGPFGRPNRMDHGGRPAADYRGAGIVDLAIGLRESKPHRTGTEFILHVVEVLEAIVRSGATQREVEIRTSCERPAAVDADDDAVLIASMPSPFD